METQCAHPALRSFDRRIEITGSSILKLELETDKRTAERWLSERVVEVSDRAL